MGVYRAAAELGLRIPDDVSVIGFDNQEPIASSLYPRLTTVALPHFQMGEWAVNRLVQQIHNDSSQGDQPNPTRAECELIWRESAADHPPDP
jgi:LacI family transcriptional regulator